MIDEPARAFFLSKGFPARAANAFYFDGYQTLEDVAKQTESQLLRRSNFGRESLNRTKEILAQHGLTLANQQPFCPARRAATLHAKIGGHYGAIAALKAELSELENDDGHD